MYEYETREQRLEEHLDVLSSNGLSINIDVSVRVKPIFSEIGYLNEEYAKDYQSR